MAPKLIEVSAEQKDFAEDALKFAVVMVSGFFLNRWRTGVYEPMDKTYNMLMAVLMGLSVFHFIVDAHIVRFVVKSGQEGYYTACKRYK
jgi:hypothetical protein